MGIITMRELLRTPGDAFDRVGEGETCVVTRNGQPVAALVPISEANAEAALIAGSPRLSQDRRDAEHARAEGRTIPLEEVAEHFGVEPPAEESGEPALPAGHSRSYVIQLAGRETWDMSALEEELDGLLVRGFAYAAADTDPSSGERPERAFGLAVKQLIEFKDEAGRIPQEFGSHPPSVSEAYVLGGVGAIDRIIRLTNVGLARRRKIDLVLEYPRLFSREPSGD
jgi:prevent-host-death family protein